MFWFRFVIFISCSSFTVFCACSILSYACVFLLFPVLPLRSVFLHIYIYYFCYLMILIAHTCLSFFFCFLFPISSGCITSLDFLFECITTPVCFFRLVIFFVYVLFLIAVCSCDLNTGFFCFGLFWFAFCFFFLGGYKQSMNGLHVVLEASTSSPLLYTPPMKGKSNKFMKSNATSAYDVLV